MPLIDLLLILPKSLTNSSVSNILKTLLAATIPIWRVLNLSAICLSGLNSIWDNWINKNIVPKLIEFSTAILLNPAYQTINPTVIDVDISEIGKKIELYQTVFNHACLCLSLIFLKLLYSISCRLNIWISLIPERRSCTKELRFATSFLTWLNATFIAIWKSLVATRINGSIRKIINDNFKLKINITESTENIKIKSATIINNPWLKILAIVSISLTVLVTSLPTDDLL